jgi:hypothetical protein
MPSFYQDRLGTNTWKLKKRDVVQGSMSAYDGLEGNATHARSVYHQVHATLHCTICFPHVSC